jgi:hypothetical protein
MMVDFRVNTAGGHNLGTSADYLRGDGIWTAFAHGASDHTDTTRSLFVPVSQMIVNGGTLVTLGSGDGQLGVVNLADGSTQGAYCCFATPADLVVGGYTVRPMWAPSATDATPHTVRWQVTVRRLFAGNNVTSAGTATAWTGDSAARTADLYVEETGTTVGATTEDSDQVRLNLNRLGADANDTYVGDVRLIGIRIDYTATG